MANRNEKKWLALFDTPEHRRRLYCYSTLQAGQENVIFCLLVHQFRRTGKKGQAELIRDWFLLGAAPVAVTEKGYIAELNISSSEQMQLANVAKRVTESVGRVGKTFSQKMTNNGGGMNGLVSVVGQKLFGGTKVPNDLFDDVEEMVTSNVSRCNSEKQFDSERDYLPSPAFSKIVPIAKLHLTVAGFDTSFLGIY